MCLQICILCVYVSVLYMCVWHLYITDLCVCMCKREEERTEELQCLSSINQIIFQTRKNAMTKPRLLLNELMQSQKIMAVTAV